MEGVSEGGESSVPLLLPLSSGPHSKELAQIVSYWAKLPAHIRKVILDLIEGCKPPL